jgi:hypothetical protein
MADYLVIDADGHCYEPDNELAKWMPKEFAHLAPTRGRRHTRGHTGGGVKKGGGGARGTPPGGAGGGH